MVIHVRPLPEKYGVESNERGPVIGCRLVTADASINVQRYADEDWQYIASVDLLNALLTLEYGCDEGR